MSVTQYILIVTQSGSGEVKREVFGTLQAAQQVAREWKVKGYSVRITDQNNSSYPS